MTDAFDPRVPELWAEFEKRLRALESTVQMSSTTVGDGDEAVPVDDVVTDAAVVVAAVPDLEDSVVAANEAATALGVQIDAQMAEVDSRLELADTNLAEAREQIEDAQQQITDAFGQQIGDLSTDVQTAITAAGDAQGAADAKPLILFSSTRAPSNSSDLAPTGSTWFLIDTSNNIMGQWQQTGTAASPTWTPRSITSDVMANLDVGKLTAGQAAIATVVAQKIAASTASFQTVNVSNLFVTSGATMQQAVIDYLFANVVQAKKITANMIDVSSLNGVTINGINITGGQFATAKTNGDQVTIQGSSLVIKRDSAATSPGNSISAAFSLLPANDALTVQMTRSGTGTPLAYVMFGVDGTDINAARAGFNHVAMPSSSGTIQALDYVSGKLVVTADQYQLTDGTSVSGTSVGTVTAWDSTWTLTGTTIEKRGKTVTLFMVAKKSSNIAANTNANVLNVPSAWAPAATQLQPGVAYNISPPYANPVQINTGGTVTVFTTTAGGQQNYFSGTFTWQTA